MDLYANHAWVTAEDRARSGAAALMASADSCGPLSR
jgi:hypothetical protein